MIQGYKKTLFLGKLLCTVQFKAESAKSSIYCASAAV